MDQLTPVRHRSLPRVLALGLLIVLLIVSLAMARRGAPAAGRQQGQWADLYRRGGDGWVRLVYALEGGEHQAWADAFLEAANQQYELGEKAGGGDVRLALSHALLLRGLHRDDQAREVLRTALKQQHDEQARERVRVLLEGPLARTLTPPAVEAAWQATRDLAPAPLTFTEAFTAVGQTERAQEAWDAAAAQAAEMGPVWLAALAVCSLLVGAGVVGLILLLFRVRPGKAVRDAVPPSGDWSGRDALEALLVFVVLQLILGVILLRLPLAASAQPYLLIGAVALAGLGAIAWVKLLAGGPTSLGGGSAGLGWRLGHPVRKILVGVAAGGAVILPALWLEGAMETMFHLTPQQNQLVPAFAAAGSVWARLVVVLGACVVAPIVEETLFRGVLYRALRRYFPVSLAMLVSAVIFAGGHVTAGGFASLVLVGVVLAWLYERTGSLLVSASAHAAFNAFGMALVVFLYR